MSPPLPSKDRSHASFRVALFLKARGHYGREIIRGISDYCQDSNALWDLLLGEDFRDDVEGIMRWNGDGVIADFDDPAFEAFFSTHDLPVVAVGSSYHRITDYPAHIPYVATDNLGLVEAAYHHLVDMGLPHFAFYGIPESPRQRWAQEREWSYRKLCARDRIDPHIFIGRFTYGPDWDDILAEVIAWLRQLPKPVGVIAASDSRARHIMQACIQGDLAVPEEVSIIGIDDDLLLRKLTRIPISSVRQGTREMGRIAAAMLHTKMLGGTLSEKRVLVAPNGLNPQLSSRYQPVYDPYIMRARHFIRQFFGQNIKVDQVTAYVGVSRTTLENHFRQTFGHTVHQEILSYRLHQARKMLEDGGTPLEKIALHCGFTSNPYMHTVFKRELGCSPREYQALSASKA